MQDEGIGDRVREFEMYEHALLGLLLDERHLIWSISELATALDRDPATTKARDAVTRLEADGLVHRCGEFVFASRAAARTWEVCG